MAETEKKQDHQVDDNMTQAAAGPAEQTDDGQAGTDEAPQEAAGSGEAKKEAAAEADAREEAEQEKEPETAAQEEAQTDTDTASAAKEKKSFFSKKDKSKEKDKDKERIAELEDRVMRQMAEFENFRRRTEKEKQQMFETGARSVIEKILPVVDNFERGLSSIPEAERQGAVAEGMNMIYKQLLTELDNIGVKAIEAVGQEFDPAKHNAVMQVTSEEYESGVVAQELQKGYTYRDTVIRHSMVAVVE